MSPSCYVQLFLFGLLCSAAISEENVTCTNPRALTDIDINKVHGGWFIGKAYGPMNITYDRSRCYSANITKVDETTLSVTFEMPKEAMTVIFTIENSENAGTWYAVGVERTIQVIFLSRDGNTMALAFCTQNKAEPGRLLLSKQLPISSEIMAEILHAEEIAGMSGHNHLFTWEAEVSCPPA